MRIDLHTHSTASDGTDAPSELVREAREAGLDVVALTDHDTFGGWAEAVDALPAGLTLVRGAELSCRLGHISLHLLALLPDPDDAELAQEMALSRDDRVPRAREMVRRLAEDGWPVSWESVLAQTAGEGTSIGRPHIADALVAGGAVPDRSAAFADILHSRSRYYVPHHATDPVRAVRLVRAAGGVPVFAHPHARRRGPVVDDGTIAAMAEAGLAALEVDHRDQDDADRAHLRGLAGDLGLLTTGSSDFHGEGKPNRLGENGTDREVYEALLAQVRSGVEPVRG
ncbi:MAG TPA: PHP domain-containing protein [Motilibacteraceae bacterium]|nr:PHP domain-containing protein [Motilibacteraceae bacterium]